MSLIIAINGSDGIVLASDSRAINENKGSYSDNACKMFDFNYHVAVAIAGDADYLTPIIKKVQAQNSSDQLGVTQITDTLLKVLCKYVNDSTKGFKLNDIASQMYLQERPVFEVITAGYDMEDGIKEQRIYYYRLGQFAPLKKIDLKYRCAGETVCADQILSNECEQPKSLDELVKLADQIIKNAAQQYYGIGGATHVFKIKENNC